MQFFELYHQNSKETAAGLVKRTKSGEWPDEWKTTFFKKYERFPEVILPPPSRIEKKLGDSILSRKSKREFMNVLTVQNISDLLYYSLAEIDRDALEKKGRRPYASGGARFPLEAYLIMIKPVGIISSGVYHYNVDTHTLSCIENEAISIDTIKRMTVYDFLLNSTCMIALTAVMSRSFSKYREHAYRFALIETGEVSQNLSLISSALSIDSVNIGIIATDIVEELLDIDGMDEMYLHSLFLG